MVAVCTWGDIYPRYRSTIRHRAAGAFIYIHKEQINEYLASELCIHTRRFAWSDNICEHRLWRLSVFPHSPKEHIQWYTHIRGNSFTTNLVRGKFGPSDWKKSKKSAKLLEGAIGLRPAPPPHNGKRAHRTMKRKISILVLPYGATKSNIERVRSFSNRPVCHIWCAASLW